MDALRHDQIFAAVSHLPHALAFALVSMLAARADGAELFSFAGAGFRDFTRIAGSSPEMWRDICVANRDVLLAEIEAFQTELSTLADSIRSGDAASVQRVFETAQSARSPLAAALLKQLAVAGYPPFLDLAAAQRGRAAACSCRARRAFPTAPCCWLRWRKA